MAFSDAVKLSVNRKAHFRCCICRRHGVSVEVHHIIPQAEGGNDTEDNAVTLCPTCHEDYGANPVKRTAIRTQRDFWYEICERQHVLDVSMVERLSALLEGNTAAVTGFHGFVTRMMNPDPEADTIPLSASLEVKANFRASLTVAEALPPTVHVTAQEFAPIPIESATVDIGESEEDFQQEPRTEIEIFEALDRLFDQIWYNRHWGHRIDIEEGRDTVDPEIWKQALAAAARVEEKYKDDPKALGPWDDFEWGMLNGKMSALRWVLGDEWDFLDT